MVCAVHVPLPRFASGWGYFYKNGLRCARVYLGLNSGWGTV